MGSYGVAGVVAIGLGLMRFTFGIVNAEIVITVLSLGDSVKNFVEARLKDLLPKYWELVYNLLGAYRKMGRSRREAASDLHKQEKRLTDIIQRIKGDFSARDTFPGIRGEELELALNNVVQMETAIRVSVIENEAKLCKIHQEAASVLSRLTGDPSMQHRLDDTWCFGTWAYLTKLQSRVDERCNVLSSLYDRGGFPSRSGVIDEEDSSLADMISDIQSQWKALFENITTGWLERSDYTEQQSILLNGVDPREEFERAAQQTESLMSALERGPTAGMTLQRKEP